MTRFRLHTVLTAMALILLFFSLESCGIETPPGYQLVWSDEFEKPGSPDPQKWFFEIGGNRYDWYNKEEQNYTTVKGTDAQGPNAWVENGALIIEARKETYTCVETAKTKNYTSARLKTEGMGDWKYGWVQVRAKIPQGKGTWPAIWMLNSQGIRYPWGGEIDLMEAIGTKPGTIFTNVWSKENTESGKGSSQSIKLDDPFGTWHIYGLHWTSEKVEIWVDDQLVNTYGRGDGSKEHWPYDYRFHLLLNVALGGEWEGAIDDTIFENPVRMYVDYVRVFQAP